MGYYVKNRVIPSGSSGAVLPSGTTAEQPANPATGMIRFNTQTGHVEIYNGNTWQTLAVSGGVSVNYVVDSFTGDGTLFAFNMSLPASTATQLIVFVGSIYQIPGVSYTVDGSLVITFTSPPPNGIPINIIHTTTG